jgi:hypothetical protein
VCAAGRGRGDQDTEEPAISFPRNDLAGGNQLTWEVSSLGGINCIDMQGKFCYNLKLVHMSTISKPSEGPLDSSLDHSTDLSPDILPYHSQNLPLTRGTHPLTPLVCDRRAMSNLLRALLDRAGISIMEASRRMGSSDQSLRQYLNGRRSAPSLYWFTRFVEACGGRIQVEMPHGK